MFLNIADTQMDNNALETIENILNDMYLFLLIHSTHNDLHYNYYSLIFW